MEIQKNISLAPLTTFKIGGNADFFVRVTDAAELKEALKWAQNTAVPVFVLGGGSNILVSDKGFRGLVVKIEIGGVEWKESSEGVWVSVGAGVGWDEFVKDAVEKNLWGIENLSGIPGTVGGAVAGNIGAYGQSISQTFFSAEVYDVAEEKIKTYTKADCLFGYRDSAFKHDGGCHIILSATFKLSFESKPDLSYKDLEKLFIGSTPSLLEIRNAVIEIRKGKFPDLSEMGTAGSFFRNPIVSDEEAKHLQALYPAMPVFSLPEASGKKVPAAWFLDKLLNWNGYKKGNVGVYKNQSLVPVNFGGASASEIKALTEQMMRSVKEKTGILLEPEVESVGF